MTAVDFITAPIKFWPVIAAAIFAAVGYGNLEATVQTNAVHVAAVAAEVKENEQKLDDHLQTSTDRMARIETLLQVLVQAQVNGSKTAEETK